MATQKDELTRKTRDKIIELFGPESALAQAMEDDDFFDKLGDLIAWLYGEIMLSQLRPRPEQPRPQPKQPSYPGPRYPDWGKWRMTGIKTTAPTHWTTTYQTGSLGYKLWSAMTKYQA